MYCYDDHAQRDRRGPDRVPYPGTTPGPGFSFGRTGDLGNSALPIILGDNIHLGVLLAVAAVPAVWWLLYRSTLGFEIRSVGANPSAARYAGMRPKFLVMLTMSLSGLLFGIAGSTEILGVSHAMTRPTRPPSGSTRSPSRCSVGPIPSGSRLRRSCSARSARGRP